MPRKRKQSEKVEFIYAVGEGWFGYSEERVMAEMHLRWIAAGRPECDEKDTENSPIGRFYVKRCTTLAEQRVGTTGYYRNTKHKYERQRYGLPHREQQRIDQEQRRKKAA